MLSSPVGGECAEPLSSRIGSGHSGATAQRGFRVTPACGLQRLHVHTTGQTPTVSHLVGGRTGGARASIVNSHGRWRQSDRPERGGSGALRGRRHRQARRTANYVGRFAPGPSPSAKCLKHLIASDVVNGAKDGTLGRRTPSAPWLPPLSCWSVDRMLQKFRRSPHWEPGRILGHRGSSEDLSELQRNS